MKVSPSRSSPPKAAKPRRQTAREKRHHQNAVLKVTNFTLGITIAFLAAAGFIATDVASKGAGSTHAAPFWTLPQSSPPFRLWASALCVVTSSAIVYLDLFKMPKAREPPKQPKLEDVKWFIVGSTFGHGAYYTGQTLFLQCSYGILSFVSELSLTGSVPGLPPARELQLVCYYTSLFMAVDALALGLLWYLLNWREEGWQRQRRAIEARGERFTELTVFIHTAPFAVGMLDLLVVKDRASVLAATPTLRTLSMVCTAYAILYVCLILWVKRRVSFYPYPFLDKIEKIGMKAWVGFVVGIVFLLSVLLAFVRGLVFFVL